jgi:winged helix DNA-binding protein
MTGAEIVARRLRSQLIAAHEPRTPAEVVRTLCAVQAQDLLASLWAIGLRTPGATEGEVEGAFTRGEVIRTWPMRGTIHTVAVEDARWMLELMAPRVLQRMAARHAELGVDTASLHLAERVLGDALAGGRRLTRPAAAALLTEAGIPADERRNHIVGSLAMRGVLCLAEREGRQQTVALLEECAPATAPLAQDEALARLVLRYFGGHGPATLQDLMWWSGLPAGMLRPAIASVAGELEETVVGDVAYWSGPGAEGARAAGVHLLPSFDELLVGYRGRSASLEPAHVNHVNAGGGIFNPIVVIGGRVRGTWKRTFAKGRVAVAATPFEAFTERQRRGIGAAAERYAAYHRMPLDLRFD